MTKVCKRLFSHLRVKHQTESSHNNVPKEKKEVGRKPSKVNKKIVSAQDDKETSRRLLFMISASDYEILSYISYRRHVSIGSLVRDAVSGYVYSAKESLTKSEKELLNI